MSRIFTPHDSADRGGGEAARAAVLADDGKGLDSGAGAIEREMNQAAIGHPSTQATGSKAIDSGFWLQSSQVDSAPGLLGMYAPLLRLLTIYTRNP